VVTEYCKSCNLSDIKFSDFAPKGNSSVLYFYVFYPVLLVLLILLLLTVCHCYFTVSIALQNKAQTYFLDFSTNYDYYFS